jgi:hypothetical protein
MEFGVTLEIRVHDSNILSDANMGVPSTNTHLFHTCCFLNRGFFFVNDGYSLS